MYISNIPDGTMSTEQMEKEFFGQIELGLTLKYPTTFSVPVLDENVRTSIEALVIGPIIVRTAYGMTLLRHHCIEQGIVLAQQELEVEGAKTAHPLLFESYVHIPDSERRYSAYRWNGHCFNEVPRQCSKVTFITKINEVSDADGKVLEYTKFKQLYKNLHIEAMTSADSIKLALEEATTMGLDVSKITHVEVVNELAGKTLFDGELKSFLKEHTPARRRYRALKEEVVVQKNECDVQDALGVNENPKYFIKLSTEKYDSVNGRGCWDGIVSAESMDRAIQLAKKVAMYEAGFRGLTSKTDLIMVQTIGSKEWNFEKGDKYMVRRNHKRYGRRF